MHCATRSKDRAIVFTKCVGSPPSVLCFLANYRSRIFTGRPTFMLPMQRRRFLQQSLAMGAACSTELLLGPGWRAQTPPANGPARVYLDTRRTIAPIDRNLFGSFLEHLGRAIYEGIYDPS